MCYYYCVFKYKATFIMDAYSTKNLLKRGHVRIMYESEIGVGKIISRVYYTYCFTLAEKQFAFQEECQSESQRPWSERFGQE